MTCCTASVANDFYFLFMNRQMLIMGNRDDIDLMPAASVNYLTTVLKLIDKYDLYGEVAYPKHHNNQMSMISTELLQK